MIEEFENSCGRQRESAAAIREKKIAWRKRFLWSTRAVCFVMFVCACGLALSSCREGEKKAQDIGDYGTETQEGSSCKDAAALEWQKLQKSGSMELSYATQFSVEYYGQGYKLLTIARQNHYLLIPEGAQIPDGLPEDTVILQQPISNIYLTATSAMDLFRALDSVGKIRLSGTNAEAWYIDEAREAMERGEILFAGKYSAPDYELILAEQCELAIESTMIYHTPEIKEQLEKVGVPVLVEYSSYETHPMGRMEWIKLYGALLDMEEKAEQYFDSQQALLGQLEIPEGQNKSVAFFYVTSNGSVNVRKAKDYVAQLLGMAGGNYVFSDLAAEDNALSTETIQMETFYAAAKDADILIYNSAIDGELTQIEELLAKSSLFADFKAVKNKNVWCTGKNLFQESTGLCDLMIDFNKVLTKETVSDEELTYLFRLQQ